MMHFLIMAVFPQYLSRKFRFAVQIQYGNSLSIILEVKTSSSKGNMRAVFLDTKHVYRFGFQFEKTKSNVIDGEQSRLSHSNQIIEIRNRDENQVQS